MKRVKGTGTVAQLVNWVAVPVPATRFTYVFFRIPYKIALPLPF